MNEHSFINYFFEIILMKKNNRISDSDLNTLDIKNIVNGFNRWDTKYIYRVSLFRYVISIRFPWLKPRAMLKYDKLRFQEIAPKFVISRN
jgi:hypothetical protein